MPDGLVNLLSDRQQFLDLAKYLIEIAEQGRHEPGAEAAQTALAFPSTRRRSTMPG